MDVLSWLESLLTPCPRHLRALGYLRELLNIKKCRGWWGWAWATHFQQTRKVIRSAGDQCLTRRKAVILGSGWLNDVPLDDLARSFRQVILVDVVHPLATRRRVRRHANVRLLAADVTGVAAEVYRVAGLPGKPLPLSSPDLFCDDPEVDLVASVNILSQLPYLFVQYLRRKGVHAEPDIEAFAQNVVRAHLQYLERLPGVVAFIGDVETRVVSRSGKVISCNDTLYGVELPWTGASWQWRLVPQLRSNPLWSQRRRVVGIPNIKRSPNRR